MLNQCVIHRTDPTKADTDGDGNDDYYEYSNFPSDPLNPDQDHDQLPMVWSLVQSERFIIHPILIPIPMTTAFRTAMK